MIPILCVDYKYTHPGVLTIIFGIPQCFVKKLSLYEPYNINNRVQIKRYTIKIN